EPFGGEMIESGGERIVEVFAARALLDERERRTRGERDRGVVRELVGDLHGRVSGADDDYPLAGEGPGLTVVGCVDEPSGELVLAGEARPHRVGEGAGGGDDAGGLDGLSRSGVDGVDVAVDGDVHGRSVGADFGIE